MNAYFLKFILASVAFLFCSCARDVANRYYATERFSPKKPNEVQLLFRAPTIPFTVIADFQSRGESPNGMRSRAAKIGADAIIVTRLGGFYTAGDEWAGSDSMSGSYSRLVGSAIKYIK